MLPKAILFDLDGTLADTALDLGGALNDLLRQHMLPEKNLVDIRPYAAHGSVALIGFGANITPEMPEFKAWQTEYLNRYERRFAQDTVLFDGTNQVLQTLHAHNIKWGIVTNKHARFTDKLVPKLNLIMPPDVIVSGDTCPQAKPDPQPLLYACEQLNVPPERCWYIGDAERDIQAGKRAGMVTVLAQWGYISANDKPTDWGADFQAASMHEILDLLRLS